MPPKPVPSKSGAVCGAGSCLYCGCSFRRPSDVLRHKCAAMQQALDDCCAGCGDTNPGHWREGGWYCEGCASCPVCDSPYCEDPSHA